MSGLFVIHHGIQHPIAHVTRGEAKAALQGDRPGNGGLDGKEADRVARSKARDRVLEVRAGVYGVALFLEG
jgi:hypothetical protein